MKNSIIIGLLLVVSTISYGQTVNGIKISEIPAQYIDMLVIQKGLSQFKVKIHIEYGQITKFSEIYSNGTILSEDGKAVVFYGGSMEAINFMAENGWFYKDAFVVGGAGGSVYHYILEKE